MYLLLIIVIKVEETDFLDSNNDFATYKSHKIVGNVFLFSVSVLTSSVK